MQKAALRSLTLSILLAPATVLAQTPEQWLEKSRKDYLQADNELKTKIADPSAPPCDVLRAKFARNYANWYQQNAAQIQAIFASLDGVVVYSNQKIAELRSMSFQPLVEAGQKQDPKVTFQTAVDYIRNLAVRKKTAIQNQQLPAFKVMVADPELSPFNLSLIQVVESLKGMSVQMNASLKDHGVEFEIVFAETEDGYKLELLVSIQQSPQKIRLNLLDRGATVSIRDQDRWAIVGAGKIGNYSIDAYLRYREMAAENTSGGCIGRVRGHRLDQPYVSLSEIGGGQPKPLSLQDLVSGVRTVCELGETGSIEFNGTDATILSWGSNTTPSWGTQPAKVTKDRIYVMWDGHYKSIWIKEDGPGKLISSHGEVVCR